MTVTYSRSMITLCHLALFVLCSLHYANADNLECVDINELPWVNTDNENPVPIVGILEQDPYPDVLLEYPNKNITSYIAASYVKFVEGGGGRVIPIWMGKERKYYEDIMSKINGVLLPGSILNVNDSSPFLEASRYIYEIAVEKNERGVHFPLWGTCLGLQNFLYWTVPDITMFRTCDAWGQGLPLEFKDDFQQSRMFRNTNPEVINILQKYPVTSNFHHWCVIEEAMAQLNESWRVVTVNHDWDGLKFVSTIEHRRYPFYGIQYHPEITLYEFLLLNATHSARAARAAQFYSDFFVSETRKNRQHFSNKAEEADALIFNYSPTYAGKKKLLLVQHYFFEGEGKQPNLEEEPLKNDSLLNEVDGGSNGHFGTCLLN